jgi:hypothetical protein
MDHSVWRLSWFLSGVPAITKRNMVMQLERRHAPALRALARDQDLRLHLIALGHALV